MSGRFRGMRGIRREMATMPIVIRAIRDNRMPAGIPRVISAGLEVGVGLAGRVGLAEGLGVGLPEGLGLGVGIRLGICTGLCMPVGIRVLMKTGLVTGTGVLTKTGVVTRPNLFSWHARICGKAMRYGPRRCVMVP